MIVPVVLSGGAGTRLWPLSRSLYPKQLLPLVEQETMLQATVTRLDGLSELTAPLVVCNESHRFMVAEQLRQVGQQASAIILEPVGRNTAPAVAVAALQALQQDEDAVLLVLAADHAVSDPAALCAAVEVLLPYADAGRLATFGVVPTGPETGYGYIRRGSTCELENARGTIQESATVFAVDSFVEKPDLATAKSYLDSGDYYWNSGMFMFTAARYLDELQRCAPDMLDCCRQAFDLAKTDLDFIRLDIDAFSACPSDSIDYAVMEKTQVAVMVPLDAGWSDVGSWSALWELGDKDEAGNVVRGDVLTCDVSNSYLHSSQRLVTAVGVENLVIVETADAVLVAQRDRVQDVKEIVAQLKDLGRSESDMHTKVVRPWGNYETIDMAERFQVKRITVTPGSSLSLQMHHHRAEHWVVVKGTARITKGDQTLVLSENQSTYIPLGVTHRLENPGVIPLELIEVQSGSYLGEDDIVRFDDQYGR